MFLLAVSRSLSSASRSVIGAPQTSGAFWRIEGGTRRVDQAVEAVVADDLQHVGHLSRRGADMATIGEIVGLVVGELEFGRRRHYAMSSL